MWNQPTITCLFHLVCNFACKKYNINQFTKQWSPVKDGSGFWYARLQLALLPSIIGLGFWQASIAEFGSLKVT